MASCLGRPTRMAASEGMRMTSRFRWFLSTFILLYLMNQVNSQKKGGPRDVKCVTSDLQAWDCSWRAPSGAGRGALYDVCIQNGSHSSCYQLGKTSTKIPPLNPGQYEITISPLRDFGSSISKFILNEKNVSLIPDPPEILRLSANFSTSTLHLEWSDKGSAFPRHTNVIWEIKVLRKENLELIKLETFNTTLNGEDTVLRWSWASDLPLECAAHSVGLRRYIDAHFSGRKEWSDWSRLQSVSCKLTLKERSFLWMRLPLFQGEMPLKLSVLGPPFVCMRVTGGSSRPPIPVCFGSESLR